MDDVKRKITWDGDDGSEPPEAWELDTGGKADAGARGGFNLPGSNGLNVNVSNVLARLDLLGTYDLSGNTVFSKAKNEIRSNGKSEKSSVPFSWTTLKPEESRVSNEWLGPLADSPSKSISNGAHRPPSASSSVQTPTTTPQRQRWASLAQASDSESGGIESGIVKWLKSTTSPDWLQRSRAWPSGLLQTDSPQQDSTPVSRQHHKYPCVAECL